MWCPFVTFVSVWTVQLFTPFVPRSQEIIELVCGFYEAEAEIHDEVCGNCIRVVLLEIEGY